MTQDRLEELLGKFRDAHIAIVGDFFLDLYQYVDRSLDEVSIETGKTAYQITRLRPTPGAAGTVASNLWQLEAGELFAIGVIGDDGNGYALGKGLRERGVNLEYLIRTEERMTPAYTKPMQSWPGEEPVEMNRFDIKNRDQMPSSLEEEIVRQIERCAEMVDAIIVADQVQKPNVGVVTDHVRESLMQLGRKHPELIVWVDSRERIGTFRDVIIKPNRAEAYLSLHPGAERPDEGSIEVAQVLDYGRRLSIRNRRSVVITSGSQGAYVFDQSRHAHIPGFPVPPPIDVVGAGDSFTAGAVLALCAGATLEEATTCGVLVSSITVQQIGETGTATHTQVRQRYREYQLAERNPTPSFPSATQT